MPSKKYFSKEDISKIKHLVEENIECLEFGGNLNSKSRFICKKCGYIWETTSSNIVNSKRGCPNCNKHANISTVNDANNYLVMRNIHNIECIQYGGNVKSDSKFICKKCGMEFIYKLDYINYINNKNNKRNLCPYCGDNWTARNVDVVNRELRSMNIPLECIEYNGAKNPSKFRCVKCGEINIFNYCSLNTRKHFCKFCEEGASKTYDIDSVNKYLKDNNIPLMCIEYAGKTHDKSRFRCLVHGTDFVCPFNKIKSENQRCPRCSSSKGENLIDEYLSNKKIEYIRQKTFDGCANKGLLKFDFYVPKINLAIEYDGEQHFKPVEQFGGEDAFVLLKENDRIKNRFCKENNINLLRISYKDIKKISEIIDKYLR